jgi:hypothetical protein
MLLWDIPEIAPCGPKAKVTRRIRIRRLLPSGLAQLFGFFRIEWAAPRTEAKKDGLPPGPGMHIVPADSWVSPQSAGADLSGSLHNLFVTQILSLEG